MGITEKLIDWFLYSSIYKDGAYRAYYSKYKKGPLYPEITAYAISLCCILYKRTKQTIFLDRAEKCAKYLMSINENGGVRGCTDIFLYTFDTGVLISSMFDLYGISEKDIYLNAANKSLKWLCSHWNGKRFAAINKAPVSREWYHVPSVHLAKLAIPLIKASIYLGDQHYKEMAFKLLNWYEGLQSGNGRFIVNEDKNKTMVHPHCYATEGFLYAYHHSKNRKYLEIIKKSIDWLSISQNPDGSFYKWYPVSDEKTRHGLIDRIRSKSDKEKVTDATAQATRLWKLLGVNKRGVERAYQYLENEVKNNGLRLTKGDSLFEKPFTVWDKVYSWPTFFYMHSLVLPCEKIEYASEIF